MKEIKIRKTIEECEVGDYIPLDFVPLPFSKMTYFVTPVIDTDPFFNEKDFSESFKTRLFYLKRILIDPDVIYLYERIK